MSNRLSIKQFSEAYKAMKARGYLPAAGLYCDKEDQKVCPVAALALASYKWPDFDASGDVLEARVRKVFGVSEDYVGGIISGVDSPDKDRDAKELQEEGTDPKEFLAGHALGKKLNAKFISS